MSAYSNPVVQAEIDFLHKQVDKLNVELAATRAKLAVARHYANHYLLDEHEDERLCVNAEHHKHVCELFAALNEKDKP